MIRTMSNEVMKATKNEITNRGGWLEDVVAIKNKREIVREPAEAFNNPIILIMERKKPIGVFIRLDSDENIKNLSETVKLFLSDVLNAAGCKLLRQARGGRDEKR
ncbi:hypothetical protein Theam_1780 (plasmid) [Thermovibrio ammonificans HB-1]|uniref:Uncharacterized protein n=1 Tax=Thermovibrio ammonificans (strain DSM 15698 / JCM 12110 / HB-1) TaxID=648996 RepID=E8T6R3_THEA1|nr:hypothetical protein [Thermovibrio ammonificans]ADU97736.1 hypothetical protein Theam_1780 [Thermovibrio ammonificans HB-1]